MNRAADQYKLRVKRFLFCGRADKNHLLNQLTDMLDDFQQAKPEADYTEYVATFGVPQNCFRVWESQNLKLSARNVFWPAAAYM